MLAGVAETYVFLRRWKEAEANARPALTIDPPRSHQYALLLLSTRNRIGNAQETSRLLSRFPPEDLLLPNTGSYDMVIGTLRRDVCPRPEFRCDQHGPASSRAAATEKDAVLGSGNLAPWPKFRETGAATEAVQNLRKLLSIPAGETISIARLKIDPVWDPIRNDPGFEQLLTVNEYVGH